MSDLVPSLPTSLHFAGAIALVVTLVLVVILVVSLPATVVAMTASGGLAGESPHSTDASPSTDTAPSSHHPAGGENTTNRLGLEDDVRNEYVEPGTDLGTTLKMTDDALRVDHDQYVVLDRGFEDKSTEERAASIDATYDRLADRIDELEAAERDAVRAHATGDRSTAELLSLLVRTHNEARELSAALLELEDRADRVPGYSVPSAVEDEQGRLALYDGSIRSELEATVVRQPTGEYQPTALVRTAESGYSLSIIDGEYVVETARYDNRDTTQPTQFADTINAYEHVQELYPWAFETGQSPLFREYTNAQLYQIQLSHEQGDLDAYLDGGTGTIHKEEQRLAIGSLPWTVTNQTWTADGLVMSVNQTPANGPIEVTVTNAVTGEPEEATIAVDGYELGPTEDGTRWVMPPPDQYELTATTDDGAVNATIAAG